MWKGVEIRETNQGARKGGDGKGRGARSVERGDKIIPCLQLATNSQASYQHR
jgi:hypothetical protein